MRDAIAGDRIVKEKGWKPLGEAGLAQTDSVAGVRGLELANVIFSKLLKYWPNCFWFSETLWDLRPFAH
jgi:hypothetical protein